MIEVSIRMPMYKAKHIAWLAFESLCRQKGVKFEWELIIAEEQKDETFGESRIRKYERRLNEVGCARIKYIPLIKWVSIGKKMRVLIEECSEESSFVSIKSADDYYSPYILKAQYDSFKNENVDWYGCSPSAIFYDINTKLVKVPDYDTIRNKRVIKGKVIKSLGACRAIRMGIAKQIPEVDRKGGYDGWLYDKCEEILGREPNMYIDKGQWKYNLFTNGYNTCSINRSTNMRINQGFSSPPVDWKSNFPSDILKRLGI